jgi:hypothetical protein
VAEAVAVKS